MPCSSGDISTGSVLSGDRRRPRPPWLHRDKFRTLPVPPPGAEFWLQAGVRRKCGFILTLTNGGYHTLVPTYPGGGIGFMYISDVPWTEGLEKPYPPGVMHYLKPDVHRAAFALPEFFRRQLA
jgi:hypothetical protein